MPRKRRLVTLSQRRPGESEQADEIVTALGKRFSLVAPGFRKPDDPFISIDVGEGVSFEQAGRIVVAALDDIDRNWRQHLWIVEPKP